MLKITRLNKINLHFTLKITRSKKKSYLRIISSF